MYLWRTVFYYFLKYKVWKQISYIVCCLNEMVLGKYKSYGNTLRELAQWFYVMFSTNITQQKHVVFTCKTLATEGPSARVVLRYFINFLCHECATSVTVYEVVKKKTKRAVLQWLFSQIPRCLGDSISQNISRMRLSGDACATLFLDTPAPVLW